MIHEEMHQHYLHMLAPNCHVQVPVLSVIGKGPKGASGGRLYYQLITNDDHTEFQITFTYVREGQKEWEFTTPPIPYDWEGDPGEWPTVSEAIQDALDHIHTDMGFDDDLKGDDPNGYTIKEYIDDAIADIDFPDFLTHLHQDLGFPAGMLEGDGGTEEPNTVYEYINFIQDDILSHLHLDLGWDPTVFEGDGNETDPNSVKDFLEQAIANHTHNVGDIVMGWPLPVSLGGTGATDGDNALNNLGLTLGAHPWKLLYSGELQTGGRTPAIADLQKYRIFLAKDAWKNHVGLDGQTVGRNQDIMIGVFNNFGVDAESNRLTLFQANDSGSHTYVDTATFVVDQEYPNQLRLMSCSIHVLSTSGVEHHLGQIEELWGMM